LTLSYLFLPENNVEGKDELKRERERERERENSSVVVGFTLKMRRQEA
jgi:hypothetical protein